MTLCDRHPQDNILARDGAAVRRLLVHLPSTEGAPVLIDAAGVVVNPWEVELLDWPPAMEAALRRGGYLASQPLDMELWCNCTD
ncbi:MAG: hypothetical protein U1F42_03435 [Candidatus Competibacteraceae bacterium]